MHPRPQRQKPRPRRLATRVFTLVLILIVALVAGRFFFSVRTIEVKGNRLRSAEEVIAASGIQLGDFIVTIKPDAVRDQINENRYLRFISIWKRYASGTVVLTVSEQAPYAKLMWMGHLVLLDAGGVVLENNHLIDTSVPVPEIIGMTVDKARIGDPITFTVAGQGKVIAEIVDALYLQGIAGEIDEINVALTDNLALITHRGMEIVLGDGEHLAEKIALVREVLPRLEADGKAFGGKLIVSSGVRADYDPP